MRTIFLTILFIGFSSSAVFAEDSWKLEKDRDGIKIWTRKMPNSNLKEYKGSMIIQSNADKVITFFRNYKLFEKWMYKADQGSFKLLKINNDNDFVIRLTMSAPFIKTRESITHFTINPPDTKGAVLINLETVPDFIPLNDNYVRIPKMKGYWKFIPLDKGKIEITHQAQVIAGGTIPDALANLGAVDAPFTMLSNVKEMIR